MRRHAGTAYFAVVTVGGFSAAITAVVLVPALPSASGQPGPVVTVTVGPLVPAPSASASPSSGAAPVHGVPSQRVVLVATSPSVGLPPSSSPVPTVLPTPSASASGSVTPSPIPSGSASPSASGTRAAVSLVVAAELLGVRAVASLAVPLATPIR